MTVLKYDCSQYDCTRVCVLEGEHILQKEIFLKKIEPFFSGGKEEEEEEEEEHISLETHPHAYMQVVADGEYMYTNTHTQTHRWNAPDSELFAVTEEQLLARACAFNQDLLDYIETKEYSIWRCPSSGHVPSLCHGPSLSLPTATRQKPHAFSKPK